MMTLYDKLDYVESRLALAYMFHDLHEIELYRQHVRELKIEIEGENKTANHDRFEE